MSNCYHSSWHVAPCTDGDIRLGDGAVLRGRVEVCINNHLIGSGSESESRVGSWNTICDHHWTQQEASVVCSHLGYSPYGIRDSVHVLMI